MKLTRDQFAAKCGVSKMAISKAVARGEVIEDDAGKVNTADAINREYLQADHAFMKRANKKGRDTVDRRGGRSKELASLHRQKLIEQIRNLNARTAKDDVERARKLDLYTERRMQASAMAAFGSEWKTWILDYPKRVIPIVYEMCRAGEPLQKAISYAEKETAAATRALKDKARSLKLGDLTT